MTTLDVRMEHWNLRLIEGQKGMLHQGLKVEKLSNFSNFKFVVSELRKISF